jgi:hypothetical protein
MKRKEVPASVIVFEAIDSPNLTPFTHNQNHKKPENAACIFRFFVLKGAVDLVLE